MIDASQMRYHWYRIGNRLGVAALYGIGTHKLSEIFPEEDVDRFIRGQMVNIGGILAKRCSACCTAKEIDKFNVDEHRTSGCDATCDSCRESGKKSKGYNEFQRRKYASQGAIK